MQSNVGRRITDEYVAELVADAYCKVAAVDKCVSGFRAAGIWPLNSAIFTDEDFAAADHLLHGQAQPPVSSTQKSTEVPAAAATEVSGATVEHSTNIAAVMSSDMVMASSLTVETATCTVAEAELQDTSTTLNTVEVPLTESGLSSS